ncbi:MAG TPA: ABC transporter substrate-binding protein [Longimicrobium sp.]|nr:ABC transporter substrate-binding protein [Longimicrobium sp.]
MTANVLDRRNFVRACALLLAARTDFRFAPRPAPQDALRIGFIAGNTGSAAARGVTLGVEEAARTGELVGRRIELVTVDSVDSAAAHFREGGPVAALVGGFSDSWCRGPSTISSVVDTVFMNVGCRADALRGEACGRNVFHVEASARMYADALAARGGGSADAANAVLWHPSLERFGAAQLNDRFRARFGAEMDDAAWAGWMAVKVLWEASLRARTVEAAGLRAWLERDSTQFDGHKGWPLSFRAWDHQLRQPLYLVAADGARVVAEVPERRAEEGSARELLDRLGADAAASTCRMDAD